MKKVLFLLMPLLVLSSCGANTQAKEEKQLQFKETTENVDEIFGEIEWTHGLRNRLAADVGTPMIGIQERTYTEDAKEYYAIRFVAALKGEPTSAIWTRSIYDSNKSSATYGNQLNEAPQTSHIYYDKLNNGGSFVTPEEYGAEYTKFAIYTMYNIPIADAPNYYIQAYVTVDGVTSKVGVGNIRNKFSFDVGTTGYFLAVNKNGETPSRVIVPNENKIDNDNTEEFRVDLKQGDVFIPVHITDGHLWAYGFDTMYDTQNGIKAVANSDMAEVKEDSKFCLNLKSNDRFDVNDVFAYYLDPGVWTADGARFALYMFEGDNPIQWVDLISDPDYNGHYVALINKTETYANYSNGIFVRMKSGTSENNWNNKWNQSQNLILTGYSGRTFIIDIDNWDHGEWDLV